MPSNRSTNRGSVPTFASVYDEEVWRVYGFFAYRLNSRSDAEDLTQQTFERALRSWGRFDPARASMSTWLLTIARNLLIDHFRRDRSGTQVALEGADEDRLPAMEGVNPGLGLEPELEAALAGLNDREREILALRFGWELSGPEIAELLELSLANVQQIVSRTLRRLRSALDEAESLPVRRDRR